MEQIYMDVDGCTGVESLTVTDNHAAPTATSFVITEDTSLDIGDLVEIDAGYVSNHSLIFKGFVKEIQVREAPKLYNITLSNIMIRAVDYYLVSADPESPFTRNNIAAEDLIEQLLEIAGITSFTSDPTSFTFAVHNPMEVNLTGIYDYCRFIADILAYHLYADSNGVAHFINRRPYVMDTDIVVSHGPIEMLDFLFSYSDNDLRNRVVVYGSEGIYAEAQAASPYLPAGYYKSAAVSAPGVIDTQDMADQSAAYNLELLNRLSYRCNLTIVGNPDYAAREVIHINKPDIPGATDDWYVYGCEQTISKEGFTTALELRR